MLKKEVIKKNQPVQGKFLSNVFLVWNKDRYHRSVINLKMLNRFVSFLHFKMEGLSQLKHLIQERNWMCKPDLKDAYFIVPLDWSSKKFARLHRNGTLYEFMWLCFGLGPAHRVFTKLLKVPISLLRKMNIRIIIYLEDMLILSHTIYAQIWVEVRSYISCRICLYNIYKEINFSPITKKNNISGNGDRFNQNGFSIDTREGKKIWNLLRSHPTTLLELIRVIGLLSSIIQAVEPAKIQQGFL